MKRDVLQVGIAIDVCDNACAVNDHPNGATHDRLNGASQNAQKAVFGSVSKYVFNVKNYFSFLNLYLRH